MTETELQPRKHVFEYINVLRFVAAAVVVADHWLYNGIAGGKVTSLGADALLPEARFGSIGVAVFFVISGFVIARSAHGRTGAQFAVGRFVRLYPAFWVALILTSVVATIDGAPAFHVSFAQFLANLTMAPKLLGQDPVDGVYWTLLYELTFYAVIFVAVLARRTSWFEYGFPAWAVLMLGLSFVAPAAGGLPLLGNYYAFFVGGAIISTMVSRGHTVVQWAGLAAAVGTAIRYATTTGFGYEAARVSGTELATWCALVVAAFALVGLVLVPQVSTMTIPGSKLAGALTYPVYLLHAHLGYMAINQFVTPENAVVALPVLAVLLVGSAYALHELVEVRLHSTWTALGKATVGRAVSAVEGRLTRPAITRI